MRLILSQALDGTLAILAVTSLIFAALTSMSIWAFHLF
jgi:hypothetical protein